MARGKGVGARLGRTFLLQAAFIAMAAAVSVFLANVLLEDVLIRQSDAAVTMQHGEMHRQALTFEAYCDASGITALDPVDQRLQLHQQWPRALPRHGHHAAG